MELYFDNLPAAKRFYAEILGLPVTDEVAGHHVQFHADSTFLCLEAKGAEDYPSLDKAVIFLEVPNLRDTVQAIGEARILKQQPAADGRPPCALLHDPEGHNILLSEAAADAHP